jgi:ABC-type nitrate/sulfonate/bicarbonate transport system permease component
VTSDRVQLTPRQGVSFPHVGRFAVARIPGVLLLAACIGVWQLVIEISDISPLLFPAPRAVLSEVGEVAESGLLMSAVGDTMYPLAVGLCLGVVAGLIFGIVIGLSPRTDAVTQPYMWGLFSTPDIAFVPIVVIWFGFGDTTKILMVFLGVSIPMAIAVRDGARTLDESTMRAAVSFCGSTRDVLLKVVLPGILPSVANGIRNGISKGFTGVLVVEMTVGSSGLGREVMYAMIQFDTARMFAFIGVLVVVAVFLITVSKRFEVFASRWREEVSL